ncbi:MAG: hypothetical protein ACREJO_10785 [Phycisphaerales bacterium]
MSESLGQTGDRFPDPTVTPVEPPPVELDSVVQYLDHHDTACSKCNYNLRGATSAACPECGAMVQAMFRWVPIRFADDLERQAQLTTCLRGRDVPCPRCAAPLSEHGGLTCPSCELPLALWTLRLATSDFRDPPLFGTPLTIWIPRIDGRPEIPRSGIPGPVLLLGIVIFWVVVIFVFIKSVG